MVGERMEHKWWLQSYISTKPRPVGLTDTDDPFRKYREIISAPSPLPLLQSCSHDSLTRVYFAENCVVFHQLVDGSKKVYFASQIAGTNLEGLIGLHRGILRDILGNNIDLVNLRQPEMVPLLLIHSLFNIPVTIDLARQLNH